MDGIFNAKHSRARRLRDTDAVEEFFEAAAVLGDVDRFGRRADDRCGGVVQRPREVNCRLPAELHDRWRHLAAAFGAISSLVLQNVADRFFVERLEVQAVAGVEVRRDRFRVGVHHDRAVTGLVQRPSRVDRTVVEFDALTDADRPATDDDGLLAGLRQSLVLLLVGAVEVRRRGVELGRARIDHLVHGADVPLVAQRAHLLRQSIAERGDLPVGEPHALGGAQQIRRQRLGQQAFLHADDVHQLVDEPHIDAGGLRQPQRIGATAQRGHDRPQALVRRMQRARLVVVLPCRVFPEQRAAADLERAHGLL